MFKTREKDARVPQLVLRDNVIAYEVPLERGDTALASPHVRIVDCADNTILWFGAAPFPGPLPDTLQDCFAVVSGPAAEARWRELRQQWIAAHPQVARLAGEPG